MVKDAERDRGPVWAKENDSRVTRVVEKLGSGLHISFTS